MYSVFDVFVICRGDSALAQGTWPLLGLPHGQIARPTGAHPFITRTHAHPGSAALTNTSPVAGKGEAGRVEGLRQRGCDPPRVAKHSAVGKGYTAAGKEGCAHQAQRERGEVLLPAGTAMMKCVAMLASATTVVGHATNMLDSSRCDRDLSVGATIMGVRTCTRSARLLSPSHLCCVCGCCASVDAALQAPAVAGAATITMAGTSVSLQGGSGEVIFEATAGTFSGDQTGCGDSRVVVSGTASVTFSPPADGAYTIRAAYASGYGAVSIAQELSVAPQPQQRVWRDTLDAIVDEYASDNAGPDGMTTFHLKVDLKEDADALSVYKIYGSSTSPMSLPAAYQVPVATFGTNIGGKSPAFWAVAYSDSTGGYAEFDSFLTVGITGGDSSGALVSEGIDWDAWTVSSGLTASAGSVYWNNPDDSVNQASTTTDPVVVAQLTVPTGTAASVTMGVQGCGGPVGPTGCFGSAAWIADGVTWDIGALVCTAVANADASTLTCTTPTDSQVTACASGFNLCESGGSEACADGTQPDPSADTCVPNPPTCGGGPFPASDCDDGLVLKEAPLTIGCPSGTCTSDDCCEAAPSAGTTPTPSPSNSTDDTTPAPPPSSPPAATSGAAGVSAVAAVVSAVTMAMALASTP